MFSSRITLAAILALAGVAAACGPDTAGPAISGDGTAALATGMDVHGAPVTLAWQERARNLVAANNFSALAAGRVYAALSVAQYRAVTRVQGAGVGDASQAGGYGRGGRSGFEAERGAVAGAAARLLSFVFPASADALQQLLTEQGAAGTGGVHPEFTRGVAVGRAAGDELVEHLMTDGFTAPWTGTVPVGPGMWIPTALPPAGAMLGSATPYFMDTGSQFRPAAPPAFLSPAFNADLADVVAVSVARTPAQLQLANYWDSPAGTPTPLGLWNAIAADYVADAGLGETAAARVFALTHAAMFDALIGCWEAKYYYWTLRPSQADTDVALAFGNPNFPSYPSGHSCASASGARVLEHFFPERTAQLAQYVDDAGFARVVAAIHYSFDVTAGQALGQAVADYAIAHADRMME